MKNIKTLLIALATAANMLICSCDQGVTSSDTIPEPKSKAALQAATAPDTTGGSKGADWPQWGGSSHNNMASAEKGIPLEMDPGKKKKGSEEIDLATTKNVKWVAKIGSQSYGTPTVGEGKVLIGTNNESPRDSNHQGDRGIVMCFDEQDGSFLWQLVIPKLGAGKVSDWEYLGVCSSPLIHKGRAYFISNRCKVVCIDMEGMSNGNDGPFKDEAKFMATGGKVVQPGKGDGDVIWVYDMREELGVFPHNIASSSPAMVDGKLAVTTSNGVDWSHLNIPAPQAPCLILLDPATGELVGEEASKIGERVMHCNWSSPMIAKVAGQEAIFFGAGDGILYSFSPKAKEDDEGFLVLPENWRVDGNLPEYRHDKDGKKIKYATFEGPSEYISSPVYHEGKVIALLGQDPEHGEGVGRMMCVDATTGKVDWDYTGIERGISTASIADGLVYAADYRGRVHCVDFNSGEKIWMFDTKSHIWGSTLVADGKVFIGNEDGEVVILKHGRKLEEIGMIEFAAPVYASPIVANGVLYIASQTNLYAFGQKGSVKTAAK
jgi:outer membrane protein assembly factor BamB